MLSAKADTDRPGHPVCCAAPDDYIPKPFEMSELMRAPSLPRCAVRGSRHPETSSSYADLTIDLDRRDVKRGDYLIELSAREYALLLTFVRNPERVFTRDQLLDLVWGSDRDVGPGRRSRRTFPICARRSTRISNPS